MKKLVFLILVFIAGYIVCLNYNILHDKNNNNENTNIINNTLNDLQAKIDTYKQKEQEEKIRKIELQQLQDPEIINTNLAEVGKLLVYEGTMQYSDIIREKNWYSQKELNLDLLYNFGISINLQDILDTRIPIIPDYCQEDGNVDLIEPHLMSKLCDELIKNKSVYNLEDMEDRIKWIKELSDNGYYVSYDVE